MGILPTPHTDFIFSIITEETGVIGAFFIGLLYVILLIKGTLVARNCRDKFGQLLAYGITMLVVIHAFMNMGIAAGIFPPTGVPLPFISYGGSSLIFMSISCGILLNISSRESANPETSAPCMRKYRIWLTKIFEYRRQAPSCRPYLQAII